MRATKTVLGIAYTTAILFALFCSGIAAQNRVTKEVCLTSFGMNWKTSEEAKTHLTTLAKREAVGELFGEVIRSISEVKDFVLTRDDIQAFSSGFIRVEGIPEFYNGKGFGELCVKINAYVTNEDIARFQPREVRRKVCIADPRLTIGEVRQTAERQARIQAVRDFEPRLEKVRDDIVLGLIHESRTESAGFISETETYCVMASGVVYPIELVAVIEKQRNRSGCVPVLSGLVSWWPGDGNADDIVDGNPGTLNGVTLATGLVGEAFSFDGTGEVIVTDNPNLGSPGEK